MLWWEKVLGALSYNTSFIKFKIAKINFLHVCNFDFIFGVGGHLLFGFASNLCFWVGGRGVCRQLCFQSFCFVPIRPATEFIKVEIKIVQ